jgi:hypothetical protein
VPAPKKLSSSATSVNSSTPSQPELAIIFLKASVDVREAIRGDIRGLDTDLQQSFTDTVAADYRLLADLLLQQNRIIEAQRVLDLLKVQELDEYLEDVQRSAGTETGVDYWQPEEDVLALYDDVLLTGTELARLQARDPNTLTPAEARPPCRELEAQQNRLYTSFIDWLDHPQIFAALRPTPRRYPQPHRRYRQLHRPARQPAATAPNQRHPLSPSAREPPRAGVGLRRCAPGALPH